MITQSHPNAMTLLQLTFSICILGFASFAHVQTETATAKNNARLVAPNWVVQTVAGDRLSLEEIIDNNGKAVMVFWATWCRYCRELMPQLQALSTELVDAPEDYAVSVVTFNIWEDSDPIRYMREKQISLPLNLRAERLAKKYQVQGTPAVFVIGSGREILYQRQPGHSITQTVAHIEKSVRLGIGR